MKRYMPTPTCPLLPVLTPWQHLGLPPHSPVPPAGASAGLIRASCCHQQVARKLVVLEGELERSEERAEVAER